MFHAAVGALEDYLELIAQLQVAAEDLRSASRVMRRPPIRAWMC